MSASKKPVYRPAASPVPQINQTVIVKEKGAGPDGPLRSGYGCAGLLAAGAGAMAFFFDGGGLFAGMAIWKYAGIIAVIIGIFALVAMIRGAFWRGIGLFLGVWPLCLMVILIGIELRKTPLGARFRDDEPKVEKEPERVAEPALPPEPVEPRVDPDALVELSNKEGKTIMARVLRVEGDDVFLEKEGRSFTVKLSSLSKKSQEFVKDIYTERLLR